MTNRRVLVIEDNPDISRLLSLELEDAGHAVEIATDGASGIEACRAARPDVILCDVGLPGDLNGHAVARALRADAQFAGTLMIALSGYAAASDREASLEAGFDLHLAKPPDFDELRRLVGTMNIDAG